jgi:hypothetical protein
MVSRHHLRIIVIIGPLLLPQNEQEIKMSIKLVGVWFLPNCWSLESHVACTGTVIRETQMVAFREENVEVPSDGQCTEVSFTNSVTYNVMLITNKWRRN